MTRVIASALAVCLLGLEAWGAYGLAVTPAQAAKANSSLVPVNAKVFRMTQPDGVVRMFIRDDEEPNLLHGDKPWLAELDERQSLVMTDPEFKGGQTGFMFIDGELRKLLLDGKEHDVPAVRPQGGTDGPAALWPPVEKRHTLDRAPDIWKRGDRLRLWFDNPNKAALLFAELALAALALLFLQRWWWKALGAVLSLAAFAGLVATSSRGGFLALLCGLGVVFIACLRFFLNWRRLLPVLAALALAAGWVVWSGQANRLAKNLFKEGQNETSRLTVWREVPRMIVDAPGGWGIGQSARSYIDWYQRKNDCLLQDMISGHFTLMVETGWPVRFLYAFVWLAVLGLAAGQIVRGSIPVPTAVLVAMGVAAGFNPVVYVPELWVLPAAAAGVVVKRAVDDSRCAKRRVAWPLASSAAGALLLLVGVAVAGVVMRPAEALLIHRSGDAVVLNGSVPKTWVVEDDYVLHGGYWWMEGQEIRSYFRERPETKPVAWTRKVSALPDRAEKIVLVGEAGRDFLALPRRPQADLVVFISPAFSWKAVPEDLLKSGKVRLVVGSVAARRSTDYASAPDWVKKIPGAELYIPGWMAAVL